MKIQYHFSSKIWQYSGPGGWYFVSLPDNLSKEIRQSYKSEEAGWGRLTVTAIIGKTEWKTAIWFDSKKNTYLLPLKSGIREKEKLTVGARIEATILI